MLRRIHIRLSSPEKLQHDVERWLQLLLSNDSLRHVRRVEVEGCLKITAADKPGERHESWLKDYDEDDVFAETPYRVGGYIDYESSKAVQDNDRVYGQEVLEAWTNYSDLSALQTLKLRQETDHSLFNWAVSYGDFGSLTTLILEVDHYDYSRTWTDPKWDVVVPFFQSLRPLRNLQVDTQLGLQFLDAILERHGCALRRLWLLYSPRMREERSATATANEVHRILQLCPGLEDLMLTVPRSKGDGDEIAIYRSLGQHPRLRRLALTLDCSGPHTELESLDSIPSDDEELYGLVRVDDTFDGQRLRGANVHSALVNTAVDGDLATSIFRAISQATAPGAFRLATLQLAVAGGASAFLPPNGMTESFTSDLLRVLGRSWLCEPHPRDDKKDEVVVTELDQAARERAEEDVGTKLWEYGTVLRKIWPKGEDDDWRKDWRSFPLQDADDSVSAWVEAQKA
ncbi:hypothetical protein LTR36_005471 [Oleoguttula mirabilis]|uniref:Uncharacterized protein n=1 Tax=Oleoguttula mirabilis TaxID=1507867 RepID=A0AAV9JEW5_9PEZI|nr:hypothetical protein LTR36_005471 [Oleoguttula mirabilis]